MDEQAIISLLQPPQEKIKQFVKYQFPMIPLQVTSLKPDSHFALIPLEDEEGKKHWSFKLAYHYVQESKFAHFQLCENIPEIRNIYEPYRFRHRCPYCPEKDTEEDSENLPSSKKTLDRTFILVFFPDNDVWLEPDKPKTLHWDPDLLGKQKVMLCLLDECIPSLKTWIHDNNDEQTKTKPVVLRMGSSRLCSLADFRLRTKPWKTKIEELPSSISLPAILESYMRLPELTYSCQEWEENQGHILKPMKERYLDALFF
jgi:hypothetical protein